MALCFGTCFKQPHVPHPADKTFRIRCVSAPFCWYEDNEESCESIMYKLTKSKCMRLVLDEDVEHSD